ncbi:MAG: GNAT family N-acetyltransferase [Acidobacteria bacterium]|nr:GNAT family N-acetyltransferase [Acidobacteriota bacterium]MBI3427380.1 GNAT family N-acetyltransferase [Acidobacteriota bacterium]
MQNEWQRGAYTVSTDAARLDVNLIYDFLSTHAYWAKGRTRAAVERCIAHSLAFGLYRQAQQIGFARVVTDYATFAYLADVFVLEAERGRGLGKWLLATIVAHPELQGLRRWLLATRDAHGLYQQAGFTPLAQPDRWMERFHEPV